MPASKPIWIRYPSRRDGRTPCSWVGTDPTAGGIGW